MSAKSKYPVRKRINPKCPICDRRVPYLLDSIRNGKRYVRCARCEEARLAEEDEQAMGIVRQLTMVDSHGKETVGAVMKIEYPKCFAEKQMGPNSLHVCWNVDDHSGQHTCSCGYSWGARSDGN